MVDILGLAKKIDIVLTEGILTEILEELKIDVSKDDVSNLVDEEGFCSSVDEVGVTSINDVLS